MTFLNIYNTLAREKQTFVSLTPGEVRLYVCGVTVYDYCHIGHGRMLIAFDVVQRWLRALGYRVLYVRNITDIDDKIIRRAAENGETIAALAERFIRAMHEDADALGVARPDVEPRATAYVPRMLDLIAALERKGYAYQAADGDVNYAVRKFAGYGRLSGKTLDDLCRAERITENKAKQTPLDFALWKRAKPDEPPEANWESRWGRGRPGWHIECSAMSTALLGERFDIHGGGLDLQFPHHENEIAQSEGATGQPFVNYWMHNGHVQIDNEKMSKSLGNFFTIRDLRAQFDAETVRFFIVRAHYRSPLHYSPAHLEDAHRALTRLYTALKESPPDTQALDWQAPHAQRFRSAMNDDFNTPEAVAVLFDLAGAVNRNRSAALARQLKGLAGTLGLLTRKPQAFLHRHRSGRAELTADQINAQIEARLAAKRAKNYRAADRIRSELFKKGVILEDTPGGTTEWRRAPFALSTRRNQK